MQRSRAWIKHTVYSFCAACTILYLLAPIAKATGGEEAAAMILFLEKFYDEYLTPDDNERTAKVMTSIALASDKENKTVVDLYNARIAYDSAIPPKMCTNNESTEAVAASDQIKKSNSRSLDKPLTDVNTSTTNPYAHSVAQVNHHKENYCGKKEENCKPGRYPNADLEAANLYVDAYNKSQLMAAISFAARTTNPDPTPPLPKSVKESKLAAPAQNILYAESAKLSLAQHSLNQIISDRIPSKHLGKVLDKQSASPKEVRDHEAAKRYGNQQWETETLENPPAAAVRDIALMMAYRIKQEERQYEQNQRIESLLAILVAQQTKQWSKEQMELLRNKATGGM